MNEPRRRPDNKCANPPCKKPAPAVPKTRQKGVDRLHYTREPFCSTECAKAYHGVTIPRGPVLSATTEEAK